MQLIIYTILFIAFALFIYEVFFIMRGFIIAKIISNKTTPVSQHLPNASKHILVIGDSTSFGAGAEKSKHSLVGRLINNHPDVHVDNFSENGMSLKKLLHRLQNSLTRKYDLVIIHIGGIDVLSMTSDSKINSLTEKIFHKTLTILKRNQPEKILLVSVNNVGCAPTFRYPLDIFLEKRSRKLKNIFQSLCKNKNITHISLFAEKNDDPFAKQPQLLYSKDGIHPNDEGYGIWYDKINPYIKY